ncbi:MAG: pyridoxamine 5'-phosphate oxidase [Gammaproteobacteria bacterium]|nr:pyridoxamine 5'-phosphate oxidase [Gammaproteobacteria bacterium]NIR82083.1 pyridoxamine 5'-phosphate oxidase [Gammaproteobacteria bacterium]NIR89316.1 pyridoxamine 5'-phosphate oxidase [Gammaproteobacteria bacterium]NIU03193.1 pyridoxamine 5'-phosphate oxidase [Gammaproteobacteria bacterium]NIV50705.1 pyridoxamine 5'-phosphate oxidase [Gammaproteobacteria bacterium]
MELLYREALERFHALHQRALRTDLREPTAVTLATADAEGRPSARTVLLKGFDEQGFVFYTNLSSRKGHHLGENPRAALCFFWQPLFEQVLVEGRVEEVDHEEADAYWATRPREAQIGAWASHQSEPLDRRETLEQRVAQYRQKFKGRAVPRPPHWSGFRVIPDRMEFWKARDYRLHDRVCYRVVDGEWTVTLLNP